MMMHLVRIVDCSTGRITTCCGLVGTRMQDRTLCLTAQGIEFHAVEERDGRVGCLKCLKKE